MGYDKDIQKEVEISPFYQIKCIIGGDQGVGKSSIVNLFNEEYDPDITSTIGLGFSFTQHTLDACPLKGKDIPEYYFEHVEEEDINYVTVKTQIWDMAGNERFSTVIKPYFRNADIAFLVYDVSDRYSWLSLKKWRENILEHSNIEDLPLFVLVGNKTDKVPFQVDSREISQRAEEWNALSYFVSCVNNDSPDIIRRMLYKCVEYYHQMICRKKRKNQEIPYKITKEFYFRRSRLNLGSDMAEHGCCILQ